MGHFYTASFTSVAVAAIQDLFQLLASATVPIVIHSIRVGQETDAGDAQAEMLPIQLMRSTVSVNGSGGTSPTPAKHSQGSLAAVTVAEVNNTTLGETTTIILPDTFNVQAGWLYLPTPEERITILPTEAFIVHLSAAPDDSITMSGSITFEEIK